MREIYRAAVSIALLVNASAVIAQTNSEDKCARKAMFYQLSANQKRLHANPRDVLKMGDGPPFETIPMQEKKDIINFIYFETKVNLGDMTAEQVGKTAFHICMENERNFQPPK